MTNPQILYTTTRSRKQIRAKMIRGSTSIAHQGLSLAATLGFLKEKNIEGGIVFRSEISPKNSVWERP